MTETKSSPLYKETIPLEPIVKSPSGYYLASRASRDTKKATFDLLFD